MIDTIIVAAIVIVAAVFIGRRLYRQFTSSESTCGCSGCGKSDSCGPPGSNSDGSGCPGSR